MVKVFYNDRTVFFTQNDQNIAENIHTKIHYFKNKKQLRIVLKNFIDDSETKNLFVISDNPERAFSKFITLYKIIEAAGGLVINHKQQALFIFRRGKWDLPKGKLEKRENPEKGAAREVEEECGISKLTITKLLETTYHTYTLKGKDILKRTYWFEMNYNGEEKPVPQLEEEITEAKWIDSGDYNEILSNTFPSIIEVMKKAKIVNGN